MSAQCTAQRTLESNAPDLHHWGGLFSTRYWESDAAQFGQTAKLAGALQSYCESGAPLLQRAIHGATEPAPVSLD